MVKCFNEKSFTLVELLVVISIIVILSALVFANYRGGEGQLALQRAASKLTQDIRRAEELSMSTKEFDCEAKLGTGWQLKGWGVILGYPAGNNQSYLLKPRCERSGSFEDFESDNTIGELLSLEKEVIISSLTATPLKIFFYPPDPDIDFTGPEPARITLSLINDPSKNKTIIVNKVGLIYVE